MAGTGTPITTLIGMDEGRDSGDAAREVFAARDLNKNTTIRDAAIIETLFPRHATAIAKGLDGLPSELSAHSTRQNRTTHCVIG